MTYLGPLDCLFGLPIQRWDSPIINLHAHESLEVSRD